MGEMAEVGTHGRAVQSPIPGKACLGRPDEGGSEVWFLNLDGKGAPSLGEVEELVIQDICTGASGDIEQATEMAKRMVTEWGMSKKLGLLAYGSNSQTVFLGKDMETHNAYSDETAKTIDEEMRAIIEEQHARATELLSKHRSVLDNMARVLIERETIYTDEVEMLLQGKSHEEVLKYMDEQDQKHSDNPFKKFEAEKTETGEQGGKTSEEGKNSENVSRETSSGKSEDSEDID